MLRPSASFRTVVGTIVGVVGALALATAVALVLLTTELRRTTEDVRVGIERVRLADDAAIDLLLHDRVEDPPARRNLERELRDKLERARGLARGPGDREALETAVGRVDAYLGAGEDGARRERLDAAFTALERLVAANVRESHDADARARRLDRFGNGIGVGTAVLLLAAAGWLLWWLRARAFEPLLSLASAMRGFGAGDTDVRAPVSGPAELREMACRFNEMAEALAAVRQRQMTFLAALAHDLRNPLSALKLATARPPDAPDEERDRTLALVRRQVLRLERQVSDFLDTARIEAGRLEVHPEPVDVRELVESAVSLFGGTSGAHRISVQLPDEQVVAPCDPGRVEQVLNNLLSNAIKYSPRGGRIDVVLDPRPRAVVLAVADEGIGIAPGEAEAIFEPFRRGRAVRQDIPGVGLGLYVSRRIIEAHGGRIRVASAPGRGSTFEVVLPR